MRVSVTFGSQFRMMCITASWLGVNGCDTPVTRENLLEACQERTAHFCAKTIECDGAGTVEDCIAYNEDLEPCSVEVTDALDQGGDCPDKFLKNWDRCGERDAAAACPEFCGDSACTDRQVSFCLTICTPG